MCDVCRVFLVHSVASFTIDVGGVDVGCRDRSETPQVWDRTLSNQPIILRPQILTLVYALRIKSMHGSSEASLSSSHTHM
jgi:hypothetical protein